MPPAHVGNLHGFADCLESERRGMLVVGPAPIVIQLAAGDELTNLGNDRVRVGSWLDITDHSMAGLGIHVGDVNVDSTVIVEIAASDAHRAEIAGTLQLLFLEGTIALVDQE